MTDIFLAFSLLFIFIIVGFWIMSKIDRFIFLWLFYYGKAG